MAYWLINNFFTTINHEFDQSQSLLLSIYYNCLRNWIHKINTAQSESHYSLRNKTPTLPTNIGDMDNRQVWMPRSDNDGKRNVTFDGDFIPENSMGAQCVGTNHPIVKL